MIKHSGIRVYKCDDMEKICVMIEQTGGYEQRTKSRIEELPLYMKRKDLDRLSKMQKIKGEEVVYDKIEKLLNIINGNIDYINIFYDFQ